MAQANYPQVPRETKDTRVIADVVNTSVRRLNRPVMPLYTVAELAALTETEKGQMVFATDGRKAGEGAGSGTGVLAYNDGTAWRRVDDGTTVAA